MGVQRTTGGTAKWTGADRSSQSTPFTAAPDGSSVTITHMQDELAWDPVEEVYHDPGPPDITWEFHPPDGKQFTAIANANDPDRKIIAQGEVED